MAYHEEAVYVNTLLASSFKNKINSNNRPDRQFHELHKGLIVELSTLSMAPVAMGDPRQES
jgi:hypothetical protein